MGKVNELIDKLCPDGVEYKELNEVCRFQNGFSFKSELFKKTGNPILRITNINDGKLTDDSYVFFDSNDYKENLKNYEVNQGDVVVAMSGATTGKIGYNYSKTTYYLNQRVGLFVPDESILSKRFLYFWLTTQSENIYSISSGSGAQPNLSSVKMMKFKLPVPPLEVQDEIIRILDKFTLLTENLISNLSAEMTARKKQYEYYRNYLLENVEGNVVEIKDVFTKLKGTPITAGKMKEIANEKGNIRIFAGRRTIIDAFETDIPNANIIHVPAVIVQSRGLINFKFYDKPFTFKNEMWAYTCENTVTLKYLYYVLKNDILYFRKNASGMGSMPQISLPVTECYKIKIPSLEEQQRIVNILDKFETLTTNLTQGLPAEIEARKKQYEYYRDKLLNF